MNVSGVCYCECAELLKDYNLSDFMIAHPYQVMGLILFSMILVLLIKWIIDNTCG